MGSRSLFLTLFFMSALVSGCSTLSAERPLFTAADQIGPAPITEGIWIGLSDNCPARYARLRTGRFPKECAPMEIRRDSSGWMVTPRFDLMTSRPEENGPRGPWRFIIVPAVEHPTPDSFAPLYVAQYAADADQPGVTFFALAPIDTMPATTLVFVDMGCIPILRDGPIDGISVVYRPQVAPSGENAPQATSPPDVQSCTASTQAAVREAARRALIDRFPSLADSPDRLVFVREH